MDGQKRRKRVLYVLNASGGGATQCIADLLKGLPRDRYTPFLIIPNQPNAKQEDFLRSLCEDMAVIPMGWWNRKIRLPLVRRILMDVAINLRTWGHLRSVVQLERCIHKWEIDIVHTNTGLVPWGAFAARRCGVAHIWHIHELNGGNGPFQYWLPDSWYAKVVAHLSDHIIAVSNYAAGVFLESIASDKVTVVYQGVDIKQFDNENSGRPLRDSLNIQNRNILVGMVAGLSSTLKRHDLFIEIASQLYERYLDAHFVVFGAVPPKSTNWLYSASAEYASKMQDLVDRKGLSDRFIWAGYCRDVPAIMDAIDILVHPCDIEGFGRIAVEAMAAGRPVVGPNQGGIAESVVNGQTGFLVPAGDVKAFAQAVSQLLEDPFLRQHMGENGRTRARSFFSLEQHVCQVDAIYKRILEKMGS